MFGFEKKQQEKQKKRLCPVRADDFNAIMCQGNTASVGLLISQKINLAHFCMDLYGVGPVHRAIVSAE